MYLDYCKTCAAVGCFSIRHFLTFSSVVIVKIIIIITSKTRSTYKYKLFIYLCLNAAKCNETKDKCFLEFPSTGAFVGSVF